MENHRGFVENLFVAQASQRARALAKAETLARAFVEEVIRASRVGGEVPPPVYGTKRRRRRDADADDARDGRVACVSPPGVRRDVRTIVPSRTARAQL